jgi:bacteriocin-like protein
MAQIKITDLNPSESGLMEELTDEELMAINGGGILSDFWERIKEIIEEILS